MFTFSFGGSSGSLLAAGSNAQVTEQIHTHRLGNMYDPRVFLYSSYTFTIYYMFLQKYAQNFDLYIKPVRQKKAGPVVVVSLHLCCGVPGFEPASLQNYARLRLSRNSIPQTPTLCWRFQHCVRPIKPDGWSGCQKMQGVECARAIAHLYRKTEVKFHSTVIVSGEAADKNMRFNNVKSNRNIH